MSDNKKWYVRRAGEVRGPFTYSILDKLARLGRLKPSDELSNNSKSWRSASDYSDLFEASDAELLLKDDERSGWDRREEDVEHASDEQKSERKVVDRREPEPEEEILRRRGRSQLLEAIKESRQEDHFPFIAVFIATILLVLLGFVLKPTEEVYLSDCAASAKPGVNWDNCVFEKVSLKYKNLTGSTVRNAVLSRVDLQGATLINSDFSYTDLNNSNLDNVNFTQTILKGANLRSADLSSATLKRADLSFADLRGANIDKADFSQAILDEAIWEDGRLCAKGSLGQCLRK